MLTERSNVSQKCKDYPVSECLLKKGLNELLISIYVKIIADVKMLSFEHTQKGISVTT